MRSIGSLLNFLGLPRCFSFSCFAASAVFVALPVTAWGASPEVRSVHEQARDGSSVLPLVFEENKGQLPAGVDFLARTREYSVTVSGASLQFQIRRSISGGPLTLSFENSSTGHATGVSIGQRRE